MIRARVLCYLLLQELLDAVACRAPRHSPPAAAADPALPELNLGGGVVRMRGAGGGRRGRVRRTRRVGRNRHCDGARP